MTGAGSLSPNSRPVTADPATLLLFAPATSYTRGVSEISGLRRALCVRDGTTKGENPAQPGGFSEAGDGDALVVKQEKHLSGAARKKEAAAGASA
jgi:hypothetical protein